MDVILGLSTTKRGHLSTSINAELLEHFRRESFHRDIPQAELLDQILKDRYRPPGMRWPPVPLLPGERPRRPLQMEALDGDYDVS